MTTAIHIENRESSRGTETINQIINTMMILDAEPTTPDHEVVEVDEQSAVLVPDTAAQAARRAPKRDLWRAKLLAAGVETSKVDELVVAREVTGAGQRKLPTWATPCSPQMVAFFEDRTDSQLRGDRIKVMRLDGGKLGPLKRYAQIIEQSTSPEEAARAIVAHSGRRMASVRVYGITIDNELRRREAVRNGIDPTSLKYLLAALVGINAPVIDVVGEPVLNGTGVTDETVKVKEPAEVDGAAGVNAVDADATGSGTDAVNGTAEGTEVDTYIDADHGEHLDGEEA